MPEKKEVIKFVAYSPDEKVVSTIKRLADERDDIEIELVQVEDADKKNEINIETECGSVQCGVDDLGNLGEKMSEVRCPVKEEPKDD